MVMILQTGQLKMLNDTLAREISGKVVAILKDQSDPDPRSTISRVYNLFKRDYSEDDIADLEPLFVAQEFAEKHGSMEGRLLDLFALAQAIYVTPESIFDFPSVFINAIKLIEGLEPNYDEDVAPSIFNIVHGYIFLKLLLGIRLDLSVLPADTADVVALRLDANHESYFPDARVMKHSYPALCVGRGREVADASEKILNVYDKTVLPLLFSSKDKSGFIKALREMKGYEEAVNSTVNVFLAIIEAFYSSQKYVKK